MLGTRYCPWLAVDKGSRADDVKFDLHSITILSIITSYQTKLTILRRLHDAWHVLIIFL